MEPTGHTVYQPAALGPPHRESSALDTHPLPRLEPSFSPGSCASCLPPPDTHRPGQASGLGVTPRDPSFGTYNPHRAPAETPYPSTVVSADGDPLELRHGIGRGCGLGRGSGEHRSCGRHGWAGCRGALPILLRRHLQRQGLGPNHLKTFLSKSRGQGKMNESSELGRVMKSLCYGHGRRIWL